MPPHALLGPLLHDSVSTGRAAWKLLVVLFGRHWLAGIANAAVTVLVGLALLWLAARLWPLRTSPLLYLRLRRLVYLVSLTKGAFYLVIGDNVIVDKGIIGYGWQIAPASMIDIFHGERHFSIWNVAPDTPLLTIILGAIALALFAMRAYRVALSNKALSALDRIYGSEDPRAKEALSRAANALGIDAAVALPRVVLVEVQCATPLLLGVKNPRLLISPKLMALLTDEELEMALRHELAHFKRRDHWWRWIQLWIEDVGRIIFVAGRLGARCVETEELLCDRLAVKSPRDAAALARAIAKSAKFLKNSDEGPAPVTVPASAQTGLTESVVPSLLGRHQVAMTEASCLERRVRELLALSERLSTDLSTGGSGSVVSRRKTITWLRIAEFPLFFLVFTIFLMVLYAKYHLLLDLH